MGCDIHIYIEKRVNGDKWQTHPGHTLIHKGTEDEQIGSVDATGRDYTLFAALAGVRGSGPAPLGLPDDISQTIERAIARYGNDGHSHSYISLDNFKDILRKHMYTDYSSISMFYNYGLLGSKHPPNFSTIVSALEHERDQEYAESILLDYNLKIEYRLIFFFDN